MFKFFCGLLTIGVISVFIWGIIVVLNRYLKKNSSVSDIIIAVIVASIFRWGFFEISTVPTGSMESTILPGDFTFVSKLHFGPRTPKTLLQIPLTHQKTHFLELPAYLSWIKIPMFRFSGFSKIKRGDVVVFNTPSERNVNVDMRTFYVKRCMGLPGEEIEVRENKVFINGENVDNYENVLIHYVIDTDKILTKYWFDKNGITTFYRLDVNKYVISTTESNIENIKKSPSILSCEVYHEERDNIFISNTPNYKNNSNWGPIKIPHKGMKIALNKETIKLYGYAIELDSNGKIKFDYINVEPYRLNIKEDKIEQDLKKMQEYVFKQDHYFMMGDNRYNSADSRFWGFVPENHIYAKTICILFSKNPNAWISGLTFKRAFKTL